ncbi:PilX N-terminal domain-containing pilus assembly protein [Luteimonas sp. S4-F44]|uniref:pilus assembly PilX family protein n=1 Tax=Luteimonas sp. S4-F44 TaxID=2925842 RepID=UPI001F53B9B1|nr:PilX N-terminal domain-containing pilus assembly protein [Luteimonas sp. S4-F44]UNK43435.1 PilX N-terminal domain-containing pilus assembly protein [Luteimonas sp. S4-F44]
MTVSGRWMPSGVRLASGRASERGISLIVVMVLLVITALLGIAILRSATLQERMSANTRDRGLAFEAAEAALRYAQQNVLDAAPDTETPNLTWASIVPTATHCTNLGVCPTGSAAAWKPVPIEAFNTKGLVSQPEYWIEYLGTGPGYQGSCEVVPVPLDCQSPIFRITAKSQAEGRAEVVLQANVVSRIPQPGA